MERPSELALRFEGANLDLPIVSASGVRLRFLDADGRLEIALAIQEETKLEHLKEAWPLVEQWKERLKAFQAPWTAGGRGGFLFVLWFRHKVLNLSYSQLATMLNRSFQQHLSSGQTEEARSILEALSVRDIDVWLVAGGNPFDKEIVKERVRYYEQANGDRIRRFHSGEYD